MPPSFPPSSATLVLMVFLTLQACGPASHQQPLFPEEPDVRVQILESSSRIVLHSRDGFLVRISGRDVRPGTSITLSVAETSGLIRLTGPDGTEWLSAELWIESAGHPFVIEDVPYGQGWWWGGREDRSYEGILHVYATPVGGMDAVPDGGLDAVPIGGLDAVPIDGMDATRHGAMNTDLVAGLDAVLHLPMETYLMGVIPYEIGPESPLEALKSQAVAARSEIVQTMITGKYRGRHHDVCADVECQVFAGNNRRSARSDSAVALTRAQVLMHRNEVIDAYYASNCGGMSDLAEKVWPWRGGPRPYLTASFDGPGTPPSDPQSDIDRWLDHPPDSWCNPHIHTGLPAWSRANFRWSREVAFTDFSGDFGEAVTGEANSLQVMAGIDSLQVIDGVGSLQKIGEANSLQVIDGVGSLQKIGEANSLQVIDGVGSLQKIGEANSLQVMAGIDSLQVIERGASGRIHRLMAWHQGEATTLDYELAIRQMVHPPLRSSAFRWTRTDTSFVFEGAGWGHGVGMCQSGAVSRAMSGHDYTRILKHYYPHTRLATVFE